MITLRFRVLTLAAACVFVSAFADDQKIKYLDKETFFQMENVSNPEISPDGSQIVFTRGWNDAMKDQAQSNLWLVDVRGQRPRELTQGSWRDSAPVWSPDG